MTIYSLYIYDRHCNCVYYHDWHRTRRPKAAVVGGLLPGVSRAVSPLPPASEIHSNNTTPFTSPRNTLASNSGIVVALSDIPPSPSPLSQAHQAPQAGGPQPTSTGLPFDEEAKLVYGVILSLRNMVKRLSGRDEQFVNYRTSAYKMHLYETLSGYKFVMLSDSNAESLRYVLQSIHTGPFLEYVVRNPLIKLDSRDRGIDNEYFRASVDRLVRGLSVFQ
ncbi:TRAPP complex subunit bet5 [Stereum hirsutum FP-91666 SS1]|uniref:TRAPP complex subunit bet5 n=1 Tax=Stereum hirsutum (strain FP-91666) TaxID=721885 RepID=UPI0004449685|nr:TRAPP complex subunit bet5 [Stereum hirsutum FP-91666 SS1]EIM83102.1 TRAPP complex subunit bet5 [Stereum hirsutum FP-91666 SS1]